MELLVTHSVIPLKVNRLQLRFLQQAIKLELIQFSGFSIKFISDLTSGTADHHVCTENSNCP